MNGNIDIDIPMNGNRFNTKWYYIICKDLSLIGYSKPDIDSRFMREWK